MNKILFPMFSLILLGQVMSQSIDATLQEKSKGKDCVKAVDNKIRLSNIFSNDHRFLYRTAYVETKFGEDENTYETLTSGGIWKISTDIFNTTKDFIAKPEQIAMKNKIREHFIDWETLNISNLHKPLYSGLAMKIFLESQNLPTPFSISAQAAFWKERINTAGSTENFTSDATFLETDIFCLGRMKMVLAVDGSLDVAAGNFQAMKRVMAKIASELDAPNVPMSFLVYANNTKTIFGFGNTFNSNQRKDKIASPSTAFPGRNITSTHLAIDEAVRMIREETNNIPPSVPNVVIVFTKGKLDNLNLTEIAASNAADKNIVTFACGFDSTRMDNLLVIAQNNSDQVIAASSMQFFEEAPYLIMERVCSIPQIANTKSLMSGSMKKGDTRYYSYQIPSEGLEMVVEATSGKIEAYYSFSFPNPSAAIHDGVLSDKSTVIQPKGNATEMILSLRGVGDDVNVYNIKVSSGFLLTSSIGTILSIILSVFCKNIFLEFSPS